MDRNSCPEQLAGAWASDVLLHVSPSAGRGNQSRRRKESNLVNTRKSHVLIQNRQGFHIWNPALKLDFSTWPGIRRTLPSRVGPSMVGHDGDSHGSTPVRHTCACTNAADWAPLGDLVEKRTCTCVCRPASWWSGRVVAMISLAASGACVIVRANSQFLHVHVLFAACCRLQALPTVAGGHSTHTPTLVCIYHRTGQLL